MERIRKFFQTHKALILFVTVGFVAGVLWMTTVRFVLVRETEIHHHANFAVFIHGEREEFKESTYYEEVAACTAEYDNNPKGRTHMHDMINDVIHVHDLRVTYGNFFENIGWTVGDNVLETIDEVYIEDENSKLTFILNGKEVDRIDNRMINSLDKLLVSYGQPEDAGLQYETIGNSAEEMNKYQDPSSCKGLTGASNDSFISRLKKATFWN